MQVFHFRTDRRGFKCVAYNGSDSSSDSESCSEGVAFVRVKDKYAALWPFLGIVAEVVVLLTVILVRKKTWNILSEKVETIIIMVDGCYRSNDLFKTILSF